MKNLILSTNRSGSTILCDLLAYAHNTINLGEGTHSFIRDYNFNTDEHRQTKLYEVFSSYNMTRRFHNMHTRGSDHINFFSEKEKRINLLKQATESWTVKEQLEKQTIDVSFIEYCSKNGVNIYITHRRDIESQFLSVINARYRLEVAKYGDGQFIYTNQHTFPKYDVMTISFKFLHLYTNVFIEQLMMWRLMYEKFKPYLKVVSYEDHIKPSKLESFGITNDVIDRYNKEQNHLIPTPFTSNKIVVTDDHPNPMPRAWDQCMYYIRKHEYLIDI